MSVEPKDSCWTPAVTLEELFEFILRTNSVHAISYKLEATVASEPLPAWVELLYPELTKMQQMNTIDEMYLLVHELKGDAPAADKLRNWLADRRKRDTASKRYLQDLLKS